MSVTKLKALLISDPQGGRERILDAYDLANGNGRVAAEILETSYQTVGRIIRSDSILAGMILRLRSQLKKSGVRQVGVGETQMKKLNDYTENPRTYN
jgi:hypothetical protein